MNEAGLWKFASCCFWWHLQCI